MKYEATDKFFDLDTMGNYQGLGKDIFQKLESGKAVDCEPPDWMVKDGYVQKGSQSKSKKEND